MVPENIAFYPDFVVKTSAMGAKFVVSGYVRHRGGSIDTAVIFHVVGMIPTFKAHSLVRTRLPECSANDPFSVLWECIIGRVNQIIQMISVKYRSADVINTVGLVYDCIAAVYLRGFVLGLLESVLVDDPISFPAVWGTSSVEHQGFPHSYDPVLRKNRLVPSGGFPESCRGGPVRPCSSRVFLVLVAEEVPLTLFIVA